MAFESGTIFKPFAVVYRLNADVKLCVLAASPFHACLARYVSVREDHRSPSARAPRAHRAAGPGLGGGPRVTDRFPAIDARLHVTHHSDSPTSVVSPALRPLQAPLRCDVYPRN